MSKIKSILAFAAVLLCGGAWAAPTPIVWWSSDFGTTAKVGTDGVTYVLSPNGNTVDNDGNLVIDKTASGGYGALIKCAEGDFGQEVSILVKYNNLVAPSDASYTMFGLRDTDTANNGLGYGIGVRLNGNGAAKVVGCIEGGNANGYALAQHASSGYMLFCYSTQSGTAVFSGSDLSSLAGGAGDGLRYSNRFIKTLGVGGPVSSTTYPAWDNLKIEQVVIFRDCDAVSSFSNSSSLSTTAMSGLTLPEVESTDAFMFNKYLTSEWQDTGYHLDDIHKLAEMTFSGEMAGANMSSLIHAASGWFVTKQADDTVTFEMQAYDKSDNVGYVKIVPVLMKIENGTVRIKGGVNSGDNKLASFFNGNKPLGTRAYAADFSARNTSASAANMGSAIDSSDSYSVASVFARTTGPTLSVAPVAKWTDFTGAGAASGLAKNGVTLKANGNTVTADGITIDGSTGGATVTFGTAVDSATIVVKYTGAITAETFGLVAMKSGTLEGGIWYDNDTTKLRGYWNGDWTGGDVLGSVPSGANEEHTLVYSYGRNQNYVVAGSWVTIDGRVVYGTGSLTGSSSTLNSFSVGGFSGTTKTLATGMKITSITVYNTAVKTDATNAGQFLKYWYEFNGNLNKSSRDALGFGDSELGADTDYTTCGDGKAYVTRDGAAHPYGTFTMPNDGYTVVSRLRSVETMNSLLWSLGNTTGDRKAIGLVSRGRDKVGVYEYGSSVSYIIDNVVVADATTAYHEYALTVSGTKIELFVDGVFRGKATLNNAPTAKFQWGGVHGGIVTGLVRTSGVAIDDWKLYETILGPADGYSHVIATVNGVGYETITAACASAAEGQTVMLLVNSNENVAIPANVTLDPNGHSYTGTLTGAGTYVLAYTGTTQPSAPNGVTANDWTGTVWIKGDGTAGNINDMVINNFANDKSKLAFTGLNGYFNSGIYNGGTIIAKEVWLYDDGQTKALTITNGANANGFLIKNLKGDGTLNTSGASAANGGICVENAGNFTGDIVASTRGAIKLGVSSADKGTAKTIEVHGTANLADGKSWTAGSGITIKSTGTIKGAGTLKSAVTFEDGATINVESGVLTVQSGITLGGSIKLEGTIENGTTILKGLSREPADLSYISVSVGGQVVPGAHIYYDNGSLKYERQVSAFWTPNPSCVDAKGIFDWSATDAWKDTTNADATWSVAADAETKPDVYIDATQIKGVKIADQIYVGNVTVAGTLEAEESFQFYSRIYDPDHIDEAVDGEHEVDDTIDCLHATSVNLTGLTGTLGLKVPITGDIAFGASTHLVFATGTDEEPSTAYGYTFVDRGGSIAVEGSGKFLVPSGLYGTPFAPASGAKLYYTEEGEVTGTISGAGSVVKGGDSTITFSGTNSFTGGTTIENGTIKLGAQKGLGEQGNAVTVKGNSVLDVNGTQNHGIVLTLAGGTVKNTGSGVSTSNVQFRSISLSADSTIDLAASTGIVYNNYGQTTLNLGNHKLVKIGSGTFLITRVAVSNGTIEIGAGEIKVEQGYNCTFSNVAFTVPSTAAADMIVQNATLTTAGNGTVFKQVTRAGGETIYVTSTRPTYVLAAGNAATLKDNDAVVFDATHYGNSSPWGCDVSGLTSHDVTVNISMNWKSNYAGTMTIDSDSTVHLYANGQGYSELSNGANISGGTINLATANIPVSGTVSITSAITGSGSFKLSDGAKLTVANKLADGKVVSGVASRAVYFNETTKTYELEVAKAFEAVPGTSASGWFSDWGGEKDGAARSVVTGTGMQSVRIVHHDGDNNNQKWHPYYNLTAKNAYTMSVYGTTDLIEPEDGKYKVLWSMGQPGNSHILAKDAEGNIVFFKNSNGNGNTGTQSNKISAGKLSGYHLITVTFSTTAGAAIWVDGEKKASDDTFTTAATNGLQVGGVYNGTYDPMKQGVGYVPTYIWAAEAIAPDAQIVALSADRPAATTFNADVEFDTNGGKLYLPSLSNASGNLFRVKKGTLIVPKDVTATLDNIEFGDNGDSHNYGLDLNGTLNISKSSTGNCTSGDIYRQNNQNDGIVFSEWTGTGTYNIRGTFNAPNAYAELVHSSNSQPTSIFNIDGGTFTVKGITAAVTEKATINLTNGGILDLGSHPSDQSIRIIKNLTNGTVNCTSGAEYDELNVLGNVTLKYGNNSQSIRRLTIAKDATATLSTNNDQLNYAAVVAHVKGTLDCGTTRQTLFDGSKIYLYNGGTITGTGSSANEVTVALDTDRGDTGIVLAKNEDNDSKVATLSAPIGAHDANAGNNTITVQEGAEDVILSIPNAASLNGRMPWVIGEGVNVKFGAEGAELGAYTSLTINGNVVLDADVTETTTIVTVAEGQTITLGENAKAVGADLAELGVVVLSVNGRNLIASMGETLITIGENEYASIDNALHHLTPGAVITLGSGVTLEDGVIKYNGQTYNPLNYNGYGITVDAGTGVITADRVFEGSSEVGLVFSEIMPKPVDKPMSAANPDSLARYDENGLESGWVELENKGDKWVDLADYKFIRVNRSKATSKGDYGNFPSVLIPPHSKFVFYTSERYSNSADMTVSAWVTPAFTKKDKPDPRPKLYGPELHNMLVWPDKINPKKFPFVRLMKGSTIIDTVVIPSDIPEGHSIIVKPIADNEATVRYMTNKPTKGTANTALDDASIVKLGPNVGPLYEVETEKKGKPVFGEKHASASEFGEVAMAQTGVDYPITFSLNPTMSPTQQVQFREADKFKSIKLVYRTWTADGPGAESEIDVTGEPTLDKADQGFVYTAAIPASALPAAGQLIQWKFKVVDNANNEWTTPSFHNKDDGYEWYGTIVEPSEEQKSATLPTWHMFVTGQSKTQMDWDAPNQTIENNARVAIYDSSTKHYYDYVRIDLRGNTSRNFTKKSHGLRFSKVNPLTMTDIVTGEKKEGIRKTSLIAEPADPSRMRQMMAFWLWNKMGNKVPFDFPVRCNLNGAFYQLAFNSERFTDELIEDVYGLDKFGYGYKNVGTLKSNSGTTAGSIEKKTPDDGNESDVSVLQNELRAMITAADDVTNDKTGASTVGLNNPSLTKFVVQKFDLSAWINYLASARITQETDDVWANISIYYDNAEMKQGSRGTGTWMPLGYDFNLTFGQYYDAGTPGMRADKDWFKSHPFYGGNRVRCYTSEAMTSTDNNGNNGIEAVLQNDKFRRLYLRRLRTLMDQELKAPGTAEKDVPVMAKMREMYTLMSTDAKLDLEKYSDNGRTDGWSNSFRANDVWGSENWPIKGHEADGIKAGIDDIWTNYIQPRQTHLFVTHAAANHTEAEIGYATQLCAGIPNKQSDIATLKGTDEDPKITARYDADLGAVVIENDNEETIDISNWTLTGPISMTIPAGTVLDQKVGAVKGSVYVAFDRRATVTAFGDSVTDQVVIGNGVKSKDLTLPITLRTEAGVRVVGTPTDQELYIRLDAFYGSTLGNGDENEWFSIKNIGNVAVDYTGMTFCFLKQGDPETKPHCHVTLPEGTLAAGESKKFVQSDFASGFDKIQDNALYITITDKYTSPVQSLAVTQKDYTWAYQHGAYLEHQTDTDKWHQVWDASVQGDLVLADYADGTKTKKALAKDLYVRASAPMTITLENPSFDASSTLKISGEGKVTIAGTLNATVNTTAIKSTGNLIFADGSYTITAGDDCIQADGDITINGGTFYCHSTGNDGIDANGDIVINGGTIYAFTAATEDDDAKSTGLDVNSGYSITINGGVVVATSFEAAALSGMSVGGTQNHQVVAVSEVSGATKAIADVIVTFPTMDPAPAAVLVSTPNLTEEEITPEGVSEGIEIVAAEGEGESQKPAKSVIIPQSWVKADDTVATKKAAEAYVLGLAAPAAGAVVSAKETGAANTLKIVDNVLPRVGTGVTVERKLKVGTTVGELSEDTSATYSDGFEIQLPTGGDKVKYIKIEYIFK